MKQGAMMTVLHTLLTALAWPAALLTITDFIDSTWSIAVDRFLFICLFFIARSFLLWDVDQGGGSFGVVFLSFSMQS